jgi:hypothetical protein
MADKTVPTRSILMPGSAGVSAMRRVSARITSTTITSPANTRRQERYVVNSPPISGPAATAIAPADATRPYARGRSSRPKLDATSATIAGMMSAAPIPSRTDQPTISTPRLGAIAVVNEPQP